MKWELDEALIWGGTRLAFVSSAGLVAALIVELLRALGC